MYLPPPDEVFAFEDPVAIDVLLTNIGVTTDASSVEVLANDGMRWLRFVLSPHCRAVRQFWKALDLRPEQVVPGVYQHPVDGCGPFRLTGIIVGCDSPVVVVGAASSETLVVRDVQLGEVPDAE